MPDIDIPELITVLSSLIIVGIGGAVGAGTRFVAGKKMKILPTTLPVGTLIINIVGTFLSGFFSVLVSGNISLFLITGFCGGFTTFITFSSDTFVLIRMKRYAHAFFNVFVNVAGCLLGMNAGFIAAGYIVS